MQTYIINPDQIMLTFVAPGVSRTQGVFTRSMGTVTVDEHGNPQSLDVTIAAGSLNTGILRRDEHLKTATFLDIQRYPVITYSSQHIEQVGANRFAVRGVLHLHGHVHTVALDVTVDTEIQLDGARQAHVKGSVPRMAFGIPRNPIMRTLLLPLIGNSVIVSADVSLALAPDSVSVAPFPAIRSQE
ncbi:MAG TPA: YceI family protein [Ktedonobacterales bacterium]